MISEKPEECFCRTAFRFSCMHCFQKNNGSYSNFNTQYPYFPVESKVNVFLLFLKETVLVFSRTVNFLFP